MFRCLVRKHGSRWRVSARGEGTSGHCSPALPKGEVFSCSPRTVRLKRGEALGGTPGPCLLQAGSAEGHARSPGGRWQTCAELAVGSEVEPCAAPLAVSQRH